ncbi:Zn-ribbon domain-containing OB-fold protein [Streptomyces sp. NPDC059373]
MFHSGIEIAEDAPECADERDEGLWYQRCRWCRTTMFRSLYCPVCVSTDLDTERSEGTGTVRRSRIVHRNTSEARNTVVIEMTEGFSVRGRLVGTSFVVPTGSRVRLTDTVRPAAGELVFELSETQYESWV